MEREQNITTTIARLEALYAAETNRELRDCIGSALDAWIDMLLRLRRTQP